MNIGLVSCIYNGLDGTKYGGRNRKDMYLYSLQSIAEQSNLPIYCFVFNHEFEEISTFFSDNKNVKVLSHDILKEDYSEKILRIKEKHPELYIEDFFWKTRCPEIMWGKTRLIVKVLSMRSDFTHVFWIDAGLSNSSIFEHKFFDHLNERNLEYKSKNLFTKELFENMVKKSFGKIIMFIHKKANNLPINEKYNRNSYSGVFADTGCAIGGLYGGSRINLEKFCNISEYYIKKMLENEELYSEESIYSGIINDYRDIFYQVFFDTFYHENWGTELYDKNSEISFSKIIESFL